MRVLPDDVKTRYLTAAFDTNNESDARDLIAAGAQIDHSKLLTVLWHATVNADIGWVKWLVDIGADTTYESSTPPQSNVFLSCAVCSGSIDMLLYVLQCNLGRTIDIQVRKEIEHASWCVDNYPVWQRDTRQEVLKLLLQLIKMSPLHRPSVRQKGS